MPVKKAEFIVGFRTSYKTASARVNSGLVCCNNGSLQSYFAHCYWREGSGAAAHALLQSLRHSLYRRRERRTRSSPSSIFSTRRSVLYLKKKYCIVTKHLKCLQEDPSIWICHTALH